MDKIQHFYSKIIHEYLFFKRILMNSLESYENRHLIGIYSISSYSRLLLENREIQKELSNHVKRCLNDPKCIQNEMEEYKKTHLKMKQFLNRNGCKSIITIIQFYFKCSLSSFFIKDEHNKIDAMIKYIIPVSCIAYNLKNKQNKKNIQCNSRNWISYEEIDTDDLFMKVNGIKFYFYHSKKEKLLEIQCYVPNIDVYMLNDDYIRYKCELFKSIKKIKTKHFIMFSKCLSCRDIFLYDKNEIMNVYGKTIDELKKYKEMKMNQLITTFDKYSLIEKRNMIFYFLLDCDNNESLMMAYMLYDLLSSSGTIMKTSQNVDTNEQKQILYYFPYEMKECFKNAMQQTIEYVEKISFVRKEIPYEQQISLMKTTDYVKERAILKLKEIKNKADESCFKAKQYLDGLLKIPFGSYKKEPCLKIYKENKVIYMQILKYMNEVLLLDNNSYESHIFVNNNHDKENEEVKMKSSISEYSLLSLEKNMLDDNEYAKVSGSPSIVNTIQENELFIEESIDFTSLQTNETITNYTITKNLTILEKSYDYLFINSIKERVIQYLRLQDRNHIINYVLHVNLLIKQYKIKRKKICHSGKNKNEMMYDICQLLEFTGSNISFLKDMLSGLDIDNLISKVNINEMIQHIYYNNEKMSNYLEKVEEILDSAVYGHDTAKRQIQRIIAQWMNGENSGYCFGFEGMPGLGKTSLAKKGIAKCLVDENGKERPFAFIGLGGSSNGSFLEGHSYTYVGSTWGKITDILMESGCMNPIIFVDELDKVSRTENGKEIIGILTHMMDSSQNMEYQDKYFNGIPIDLSKILFIFSYNDVEVIDKILLDRIHRITFDSLSIEDKMIICRNHLLPDMYDKLKCEGMVVIKDDILEYIIRNYTREAGVRKCKELLFEILSEIQLDGMKNRLILETYPLELTKEMVDHKYLKDKMKYMEKMIERENTIGVINGLWANNLKEGGVLEIEAKWMPTSTFLSLTLTGMQGDVMKESMNISKTLAWNLCSKERKDYIVSELGKMNNSGIHIHCPEGSVPKDGPSAGIAITVLLYSLFMNKKIRSDVAVTGEIRLTGEILGIGGLERKILGGMKVGIKKFIYPKENERDYEILWGKHKNHLTDIEVYAVSNINEVFNKLIIDD